MLDLLVLITVEARAGRTVLLTAREADGSVGTREIEPYTFAPATRVGVSSTGASRSRGRETPT